MSYDPNKVRMLTLMHLPDTIFQRVALGGVAHTVVKQRGFQRSCLHSCLPTFQRDNFERVVLGVFLNRHVDTCIHVQGPLGTKGEFEEPVGNGRGILDDIGVKPNEPVDDIEEGMGIMDDIGPNDILLDDILEGEVLIPEEVNDFQNLGNVAGVSRLSSNSFFGISTCLHLGVLIQLLLARLRLWALIQLVLCLHL